MCGIVGGVGSSAPSRELLQSQLNSILHRGPDDQGIFVANQVALGMCRLAIVEVDSGRQPASDSSNSIHMVWNGEIYNYVELRRELQSSGITFRDSSESEVLINLYLKLGIDFVSKINGMFAIAIYDSRIQTLHLVRDRLGKKPLWVSELGENSLLFASEVRALMVARTDRTLRKEMVSEVLQFGYVSPPLSTFNEIEQVPPAHVMTWRQGKKSLVRYWAPDFNNKTNLSYMDAVEKTSELLEGAVKRRLVSERPIGSFLSGGFDSTVVTAFMSRLMSEKFQTFSIGFDDTQYDESIHAKRIAEYLETSHHEEILRPNPSVVLEDISMVLDQPLADSSIIPTYLLAKFARNHVIVALGGDGGDEVFGGYDRYIATPFLQTLNPVLGIAKYGLGILDKKVLGTGRKINRASTQLTRKPSLAHRFASIHSLAQSADLVDLLSPDFLSYRAENQFMSSFNSGAISDLDRMVRSDLTSYLPGDLLVKADMATMANSLELRSPMLDVNVVEWGVSLPKSYRIKGLESKRILKDVVRAMVPSELVDRPKMGFGIPRAHWLRTGMRELVHDILTDSTASQRGWFNSKKVREKIDLHMAGQNQDHLLWPILVLELWARTWLD